ncbi:hypothetical protein [Flavihumibacter petaseus]|uniref:2-dehydro-3-deoxyphosphooctonate aldolase n=1 Tax=Flavihumibacter petaseus NBRC 106054 TaxID=1220578 RepID=A0A0E9N2L0_9BACT|nr:hypothetical protein [Flavihumibacter petaseus]GAO43565.1 hypothetical protein FPE01S_02_06700 [Flavihumibacter petaseus NBRC 106054]
MKFSKLRSTTLLLFASLTVITTTSCSSAKKSTSGTTPKPGKYTISGNAFVYDSLSTDTTYGYSKENPIKVGSKTSGEGPSNERRYLNALLGPHGEQISYERRGSCCHFKSKYGMKLGNETVGTGLLDIYVITWAGQDQPVILYLNMYDPGELLVPVGFTVRNDL